MSDQTIIVTAPPEQLVVETDPPAQEVLQGLDGLTKASVGLDQVDNTADIAKPVSVEQSNAIAAALAAAQAYADSTAAGLLDDRGSYDASANLWPSSGGSGTAGAIKKGDLWYISVAGTLGGVAVNIGDAIRAITDAPGQTAGNWSAIEGNLGFVPEVAGVAATLDAAHVAAGDPHPQYTTAGEAAAAAPVQSVAGRTGAVTLDKTDVGLSNVDNTADTAKPVSTAQQTALNGKTNQTGFPVDAAGAYLTTLTYNETTRTITITPTGATFDVLVSGTTYTKTGAQSIVHAATQGPNFIYYDATGTLVTATTAWDILLHAPVAFVFWDATNSKGVPFDERHHAGRDLYWHRNQHFAEGTKATSGFAASGYTLSDGSADTAVTFAIAAGRVEDEDIIVDTQALPDNGPYTLLWRSGASGDWQIDRTPVRPFFDSANILKYNQYTGATWQKTSVTEDYYVNYYVFAATALPTTGITPSPTTTQQIVIVPGQAIHASQALATAESVAAIAWGTMPFQEIAPLYRVTLRYNASNPAAYSNTARCAIVAFTRIIGTSASIAQAAVVNAGAITTTPAGNLAATNVQAALDELQTDVDTRALAGSATSSGLTMSTARLLGRSTAATGAIEEITLGTGLSFSGTTLNAAAGGSLSSLTAASAANSINNADYAQTWNWALTTAAKSAFTLTENSAATGGSGSQYLVDISTLSASTANPFRVKARGGADNILVSRLGAVTITGSTGAVGGGTTGSAITLTGGQGASTSAGGDVTITTGAGGATSGSSGSLSLRTGGTSSGASGPATFGSGNSVGNAGPTYVYGGNGAAGGLVTIQGGTGASNQGGGVTIQGGQCSGANGGGGEITITAGNAGTTTGSGGGVSISGGSAGASGSGTSSGSVGVLTRSSSTGNSGSIDIYTGNKSTSGYTTGSLNLHTGNATGNNGTGGVINLYTGYGDGSGAGGALNIYAGAGGSTGNGGAVSISAGARGSTGAGANVSITASNGSSGVGGDIVLTTGTGSTNGAVNFVNSNVANGAVATTLGSVGPTGAGTTVAGWLAIKVGGTARYIPFW